MLEILCEILAGLTKKILYQRLVRRENRFNSVSSPIFLAGKCVPSPFTIANLFFSFVSDEIVCPALKAANYVPAWYAYWKKRTYRNHVFRRFRTHHNVERC